MHKQKVLCSGEATGQCCKHYWAMTTIVSSHNPDFLKQGERHRFCRAWGVEPLAFGDGKEDMAVKCNIFEPDEKRPYEAESEEYNPITSEELKDVWKPDSKASFKSVTVDDVLADDHNPEESP